MEKSGLKWLRRDELQPPDTCKTLVKPSGHDWFHGLQTPAEGANPNQWPKQMSLMWNNPVTRLRLTMLVPTQKWLESAGKNFKWSVCNVAIFAASRVDLRDGQKEGKSKGQRLQQSRNGATWNHIVCKHMHTALHKQQTRSHDHSGAAAYRRGWRHPGGILRAGWQWRMVITGRPSTHLSAARREELCSSLTLPPGRRPVREAAGRGRG